MRGAISRKILADGAAGLGVTLGERAAERLTRYIELILKWSRRVDLTGLTTPEAVANRLILDSLALVRAIAHADSVIDVGSGAGIPGIPLAVARPDLRVTLVEPRERRAAFLRTAIDVLGIDARLLAVRLEAVDERFDWVVSKAFLPPEKWVVAARRLARPGGRIALWTHRPTTLEANERIAYRLPDGSDGLVEVFHVKQST
ncbi:MAG: 16S rRNA (guanine(527)-N(7))-methyltransferase RsmG [Myxococcota bacterium]